MDQLFQSVVAGVSIYIVGQAIQNFVLKPLTDFKQVLLDISHKVKFHSNIITNSIAREDLIKWASGDMRDLSCNLESKYLMIPFNSLFVFFGLIPIKNKVYESSKLLISLSNAGGRSGSEIRNDQDIDKIKEYLNLNMTDKNDQVVLNNVLKNFIEKIIKYFSKRK